MSDFNVKAPVIATDEEVMADWREMAAKRGKIDFSPQEYDQAQKSAHELAQQESKCSEPSDHSMTVYYTI